MDTMTITLIGAGAILVAVVAALFLSGKFKADEVEIGLPFLIRFKGKRVEPPGPATSRSTVSITGESRGKSIDLSGPATGEKTVTISEKSQGEDIKL